MTFEQWAGLYLFIGVILGISYTVRQHLSGGATFYDQLIPMLGPFLGAVIGMVIAMIVCAFIWPLAVIDWAWKGLKRD